MRIRKKIPKCPRCKGQGRVFSDLFDVEGELCPSCLIGPVRCLGCGKRMEIFNFSDKDRTGYACYNGDCSDSSQWIWHKPPVTIDELLVRFVYKWEHDHRFRTVEECPREFAKDFAFQYELWLKQQQWWRKCANKECGHYFIANEAHQKYCSRVCAKKMYKEQQAAYDRRKKIRRRLTRPENNAKI